MKKATLTMALVVLLSTAASNLFAFSDCRENVDASGDKFPESLNEIQSLQMKRVKDGVVICWEKSATSGDEKSRSFSRRHDFGSKHGEDGWLAFPAVELGMGSGTLSASLGVAFGYKSGHFLIGTSLRGQVVNIDRVNYQFMPYTVNVSGLSYSLIPETTNAQNNKTLRGQTLGIGMGGKLTFGQLIEKDPDTNTEQEYLTINFGTGF